MDWMDEIGVGLPIDESIEVLEHEDHSWEKDRLGMITGSNFAKLVKKSRDKKNYQLSEGKVAQDLMYKIAWERLLKQGNISNGLGRLNVSSREMQHGQDYEGAAIQKFEEVTGLKVDYSQKFNRFDEWIGGTPDAYVGDDAIIEVKSPWNGGNHLKSICTGEIYNDDYVYQVQGYLWITGRSKCYFVTYDPDLIEELQLNIIEVARDQKIIDGIKQVMETVKQKIQEIIDNEKLKK